MSLILCIFSFSYEFGYYIHGTAVLLTYLTIPYFGNPGTGGQAAGRPLPRGLALRYPSHGTLRGPARVP